MIRWWMWLVAAVTDVIAPALLVLLLVLAATLVAVLWYFWPYWLPGGPSWRLRPRSRSRKRRERKRRDGERPEAEPDEVPDDDHEALPDRSVTEFTDLADRLAAEGRYAEAVRERLRAIVRDLVDRQIIEHRPGWTVTELAGAAAAARPAVSAPLNEAAQIFSEIWYGMRPAAHHHDLRMRALTGEVRRLADPLPTSSAGGAR